ncbi:two-component system LytT family response regulator [Flavobacterium sp. 28YEA47A]|uniref:LytR/AlgR family response regulator transcription factor n=1 Tax=Flavobacterium sp. 28YEA47A TaxID=3156276 RepID=UPI00351334F1
MHAHKALIIDDEVNNIAILKHFVTKYCLNVEVVGEAMTIAEAISEIKDKEPDILFLDIKLNEGNSFEILDQLENLKAQVIFVTSYDEYALKAFKYNAVDYILKPIVIEDIILAVNKAIKNIEQQDFFDFGKLTSFNNDAISFSDNKEYIAIPSLDKVDMVKSSQITYIEADSKYTVFHTQEGKKYISSKNLLSFEETLDKTRFFRVHHSFIVNIEHLVTIIKKDGSYCEISDGTLLPIARRKLEDFHRFLKIKN